MRNLSKNIITVALTLFFILFLFLPISIPGMTYIKTYMLITVVFALTFLPFIKIYKLYTFEVAWLFLLIYLSLTFFLGDDYTLAFKALIGEAILVCFYFLYRFFLGSLGAERFNKLLLVLGKAYFVISLAFFLLGIYLYFIKGVKSMPMFYPEQANRVLGGIFNKWTGMPRLVGLRMGTDSFNWMSAFFTIVFFKNKKNKWALLGLICSLMTFSITFLLVLAIALLYIIIKKGKLFQTMLFASIVSGIVYYYYLTNAWFHIIIQSRIHNVATGTGRFDIWGFVVDKALEKPIFGHGMNQLKVYLTKYSDTTIRSAHNSLLEIFFNAGIIGVAIYLIFLSSFFLACYNLDRRIKNDYFKTIFLCYFVFSMANTSIYEFSGLLFFGFIFIHIKQYNDIEKSKVI